jgi:hypothetical protein
VRVSKNVNSNWESFVNDVNWNVGYLDTSYTLALSKLGFPSNLNVRRHLWTAPRVLRAEMRKI